MKFRYCTLAIVVLFVIGRPTMADAVAIGSVSYFYVGGEKIRKDDVQSVGRDPVSGSFIVDQIGVLKLEPSSIDDARPPVILTPGFGLAGHIYLTTADGRPGWAYSFLREGHTVYIIDRSHTVRTGFDAFAFNEVRSGKAKPKSQPSFVLWLEERIWTRWGLGPAFGEQFDDGKFPLDAIDQLVGAFVPVLSENMPLRDQAIGNAEGLIMLLDKTGPGILVTHSASGLDGFKVAMQRPDLVRAVVSIEPVGCDPDQAEQLREIPTLTVFGDHLDVRPQMIPRREECMELAKERTALGKRGEVLSLPDVGVNGNSHIMMSDTNSNEIAYRIIEWLKNE